MKHLALLSMLLILCSSMLFGQIFTNYTFSASTGTYIPITGTTITEIQDDDELSGEIPIGFTFVYGLDAYTSVKVSSNGWIGLGASASSSNLDNILSAFTTYPIIAPLWDDLNLINGNCQYLTTGIAPARIFTVQYQNVKWNYSGNNQFNFQVRLHENGKVELIYGTSSGTPNNASASIGININPGGLQNYYSITPGTPATASFDMENFSVNTYPGEGTIYTFDAVLPVPNDIAAFNLMGNLTPSQGSSSNYTITLRNLGTAAQNNYTVKLMSGTDVLVSVAGQNLPAGMMQDVVLPWIPANTGVMSIYGKVELAGDAYPQNDITNSLNIEVQPFGTFVVTIGDGNETANIPMDFYWKNSLFETIYLGSEIGGAGLITGIRFYNNFETNLLQKPTKIWLGSTLQTDLSSGWIPSTSLTQVFDGNVDYPSGINNITIQFAMPFVHVEGNLVMLVQRPMDTIYFSPDDLFKCHTSGTSRSRRISDDSTVFDPANPPDFAEVSGQLPNTSLFMMPIPTLPTFAVTPTSKDFGSQLINTTSTQQFTMVNIGGGSFNINSVSISGSQYFTIQNPPVLPLTLPSLISATFTVRYLPTAAGSHTATITIIDNLNRLQHDIQLSGNCIDPTIYTSPYVQNFDSVVAPALPMDWNKLFQPAVMWADIQTVTENPYNPPNCVIMGNAFSQTSDIMLIAPPLSANLNITLMRVKFRAKSFMGSTMHVGVMSDITDATTFISQTTITMQNNWTEYVVAFQTYTGTGRYIAFKHGNFEMFNAIYIDAVTIENTPQNDLAAISITGNNIPIVNMSSSYTVTVYNWGTNPQSNYLVKLYKAGDIELASVPGPLITPDTQQTVTITWTPNVAESTSIYGKVILTGDQNGINDQTMAMNVLVQSAGTTVVNIGAGDQLANIPVNMYWCNSLFETIYDAGDITGGGAITALAFYNDFVSNLPQKPTKIWLGETTQNDLSGGWIPSTQLTLVFDGLVDYPSGENTIVIPLTNQYTYTGTNLVMMVQRPMDSGFFNFEDFFYAQTIGNNRSLSVNSDETAFDPANPPTDWFTLNGQFPKTSIFFAPTGPNPLFGIAPSSKNYGTVLLNNPKLQTFTMFNYGGAPLIVNSIAITGSSMFSLQNLPTLPITLNPGQNTTFIAQYLPATVGNHTATITINDNLSRAESRSTMRSSSQAINRTQHIVTLTGMSIDPTIYTSPYLQNFDAALAPSMPIDWQSIYQVSNGNGYINTYNFWSHSAPNSISMYNADNNTGNIILIAPPLADSLNVTAMRVKFWAQSENAALEVGVISDASNPATFTPVQTLNFNQGWAEYIVSFQTYTGTGNKIAFRHGLNGLYQNIFIDDVLIEKTPQNDLAALSISGNSTPSVGMVTNYIVNVFNWGTNPQANYTVKLFSEGDIEVASIAGPLINPGLMVSVAVSWIPTAVAETYIYGKVVLTGDQNDFNNQTNNIAVYIQPAGTFLVTIGYGSLEARVPVDMYYYNSLFETMFYPAELNFAGMIEGISFYNCFTTNIPEKPTNIWMGTTTQADFSSGWIPSTNLTQVYSGNVNYPSGDNMVTITFSQPFLYLQGNLVLMVERAMDASFYSFEDMFYCQEIGNNRSLAARSDETDFDPASPPTENYELSGLFPKTSLRLVPVDLAHLEGHVYGANNIPLNNATVQILNGGQAITDAQGFFRIQNILAGTYQITASRYGYNAQTLTVIIPEDTTIVQNFNLTQMPTVNVTGYVMRSDMPTIGIQGASISLTGYENYAVSTDATGYFTISGVYTNHTYAYQISALGYQTVTGNAIIGSINHNMGTIILNEIAYTPRHVQAILNTGQTEVAVSWLPPDPNAVDITQGFEDTAFPPTDWTRIVANNGPALANGVYPTWCRIGTVVDGLTTITPPEGNWQCGFWLDYNYQDEWLITPQFSCPPGTNLIFRSCVFYGSTGGDHYYVKISNNNGISWDVLWDASTLTGGLNNYQTPIIIDLSAYAGQQVMIAWHADDFNNEGMWHYWFIDNILITNDINTRRFSEDELIMKSAASRESGIFDKTSTQTTMRESGQIARTPSQTLGRENSDRIIPNSRTASPEHRMRSHSRSFIGYQVWRLVQGQEMNENNWVLVTPSVITTTNIIDNSWQLLSNATYKWAVKAVYSNNIFSAAVFSQGINHQMPSGTLSGYIRNVNSTPIQGAVITAGVVTATSSALGFYSISLPVASYNVSCTAPGYQTILHENIAVNLNQTTTLNFVMPLPNADDIAINTTFLNGNYPNPFNPETTISFDIKTVTDVRIGIYNTKGQLVCTLINEIKDNGHHTIVWNGKDNHGNALASGIYYCKMQAGNYRSIKRMMLLK